jgi:NADH-quinone oxidoreductase subunit J
VLVYIGAVAILLMFGIMLTRNIQGDDPTQTPSAWRLPGLAAGLGVFLVLAYGIAFQKGVGTQYSWTATEARPSIAQVGGRADSPRAQAVNNMAKVVGEQLTTRYVIAFEVAGLLLTVALVGAIAIAHREEEEPSPPRGTGRSTRGAVVPAPTGGAAPASVQPVTASAATSSAAP